MFSNTTNANNYCKSRLLFFLYILYATQSFHFPPISDLSSSWIYRTGAYSTATLSWSVAKKKNPGDAASYPRTDILLYV